MLADEAADLIATMEHSVLGPRWVYDAPTDPVFADVVLSTIRDGGTQAVQEVHRADGTVEVREPTARARGVGGAGVPAIPEGAGLVVEDADDSTVVTLGPVRLEVVRRLGTGRPPGPALVGEFAGGSDLVLAGVSWTS